MLTQSYPFQLPPLDYPYEALEPAIDTETMQYHHDKHFQTYINNLNKALEPYPDIQKLNLKQLLIGRYPLPTKVKAAIHNNGGGVYNHDIYFKGLAPASQGRNRPEGRLLTLIEKHYGSFERFKEVFSTQALSVFGSGWTALTMNSQGILRIASLKNQETVLSKGLRPLIIIDVWEHAYYLKYKNLRADYVKNIWEVIRFPLL